MPKIDPITGVPVMTHFEFIAEEAKRAGKEPGELMQEMRQEEADDQRRHEKELRHPANALEVLRSAWLDEIQSWKENQAYIAKVGDAYHPEEGDRYPRPVEPVEVLEVLEVTVSWTFRESKQHLKARARGDDGAEHVFVLDSWDYSGSFYEPPSSEWELVIDPKEDNLGDDGASV